MADPKYAGLPGIDASEKDVYESGDLPEDDQNWSPEELSSESVETENVDTKQAYEKFNSKFLSRNGADFSEKIGGRRGYEAGEYSTPGVGETETPTQKLQRLMDEVSQLGNEIKTGEGSKPNTADLISRVHFLQKQLLSDGQGDVSNIQGSFERVMTTLNDAVAKGVKSGGKEPENEPQGSYSLMVRPDQIQQKVSTKVADMEARITKIEKAVGIDTESLAVLSAQTKHKNLKAAVEGLEVKANLLDPEKLPQVDTRLQAVLNKLNDINKAKKQSGADQVAMDKKILEIYDTVQKWDSVCASLPSIVHRLETLNHLHQQAANFTLTIQHLETTQSQIAAKLSDTTDLTKKVDDTMKQNLQTIQTNLQSLEKKIQNLKK